MILLKMDISYLSYNIYMDVVNEIEVLEADVKDCEEKCKKVNCSAIYDAIISTCKLWYDLVFLCFSKKKTWT